MKIGSHPSQQSEETNRYFESNYQSAHAHWDMWWDETAVATARHYISFWMVEERWRGPISSICCYYVCLSLSLWVVEVKYKVSRCSFSLIKAAVSHKLTLPHKTPAPLTLFLLLQSHFTNSCLNNLHSSNPGQRTWNCKINVKRIWGDLLKQALSLSKIFHFNFSSRELQKPLLLTCFN